MLPRDPKWHSCRDAINPLGEPAVVGGLHHDSKLHLDDQKATNKVLPYLITAISAYVLVFMGPACVADPTYMPGGALYPKERVETMKKAAREAGKTGMFYGGWSLAI